MGEYSGESYLTFSTSYYEKTSTVNKASCDIFC